MKSPIISSSDTDIKKPTSHFKALDGIRGLAVILVFLSHCSVKGFEGGGGVGVTMFFVLSGFLISLLLFNEIFESGTISLRYFYARRALRLFPALYLILAICCLLGVVSLNQSIFILLYIGNWARVIGNELGWLHHTWSLAVEEQYYLLWPLVVIVFLRFSSRPYKNLGLFCIIGAAVSVFLRYYLWEGEESILRVHFGTDTNAFGLLIGSAAACAFKAEVVSCKIYSFVNIAFLSILGLCGIFRLLGLQNSVLYSNWFTYVWNWPLSAICSAVIILAGVRMNSHTTSPPLLLRAISSWPLTGMGKISYGFYLWHAIVIFRFWPIARENFNLPEMGSSVAVISVFGGSLACSWASYYFLESPLLKIKRKLH